MCVASILDGVVVLGASVLETWGFSTGIRFFGPELLIQLKGITCRVSKVNSTALVHNMKINIIMNSKVIRGRINVDVWRLGDI